MERACERTTRAEVRQTMRDMQWRPKQKINIPPKEVNRDVSLPAAWAHLAKG